MGVAVLFFEPKSRKRYQNNFLFNSRRPEAVHRRPSILKPCDLWLGWYAGSGVSGRCVGAIVDWRILGRLFANPLLFLAIFSASLRISANVWLILDQVFWIRRLLRLGNCVTHSMPRTLKSTPKSLEIYWNRYQNLSKRGPKSNQNLSKNDL